MDVKYLNPIIAATDSVFETMLSLKPEKGKVSFQEELITDKEANPELFIATTK
jgi:chemotaxis protein CheX